MARSKSQQIALDNKDYVEEILSLRQGLRLHYRQYEGSFSNPNGRINEQCLEWLVRMAGFIVKVQQERLQIDSVHLLELYCGCGNHTMALAHTFHQVTAVELDKKLCEAARRNAEVNQLADRVQILQSHSEKFCHSVLRKRSHEGNAFHAILVDPPRAGLDPSTLELVSHFDFILYISCNPTSLMRDLNMRLASSHKLVQIALFDQFAGTPFLEAAICLCKQEIPINEGI